MDTAPDITDESPDWRAATLRELAELGMRLARALVRAVEDGGVGEEPARVDPGLAFARVSRAVRLTLALDSKLADEALARARGIEAERVERRKREKAERLGARRNQITDTIWREAQDGRSDDEAEDIMSALDERLCDLEDWDAAFLDRPVEELIDQIRADLGLAVSSPSPSRGGVGVGAPAPCSPSSHPPAELQGSQTPNAELTPPPQPLPARGRGLEGPAELHCPLPARGSDEPPWVAWAGRPSG